MTSNDKELLNAIKADLESGFRHLMRCYQQQVYWHIRRMVVSHDDAQDGTQETFIRIYNSLAQFRADSSLRSWIYRIATNEALRIISRRRQEEVSIDSDETGVELIAADDYVDTSDQLALKLQRAILTLPPKQQLAFNLRYYDEMEFEEIAQIADSTATSIKASYHVAKQKIINYMNSHD